MIKFGVFENQPVIYGLSAKRDGPMNFRFAENRRVFLTKNNLTGQLVLPRLQHENKVVLINRDNIGGDFQCDALITKEKGILLGVTVADCFPVYFFDSVTQAVGVAHCGWRGILKNIIPNTITAFQENFESKPENILLAIGPGLRFCHFVVQDDVIGQFAGYESFTEKKKDGHYVDLEKVIHYQAMKAGVRIVEAVGICTYESEDCFSYRRDKLASTAEPESIQVQSMLAYIGLV